MFFDAASSFPFALLASQSANCANHFRSAESSATLHERVPSSSSAASTARMNWRLSMIPVPRGSGRPGMICAYCIDGVMRVRSSMNHVRSHFADASAYFASPVRYAARDSVSTELTMRLSLAAS